MKLMKRITIALILCAIPAMALGQVDIDCTDCSHVVSVYKGEGGLIAESDAEMVTYLTTCGGVTRTDEQTVVGGKVAMLFTMDNMLACSGDDGEFEIGPVMDGGWYWITDETNSAVGSLVAKDILDNTPTEPTNAGAGVMVTEGKGAVMVKETATGRVGILPTILPMKEVDPTMPTLCGSKSATAKRDTECMLGDGGTMLVGKGPVDPYTGKRAAVMEGAIITRPATGSVVVSFHLEGNGTGHYTSGTIGANNPTNLGHPGGTPLDATISGTYGDGLSNPAIGSEALDPNNTTITATAVGLQLADDSTNDDIADLTIHPNATYCSKTANHSVTVTIAAQVSDASLTQVVPAIDAADGTGAEATMKITVACPAASSQLGVELVPENPFPTD